MHPIPVIRNSPEDGHRREQRGFRYNFIMEDADEDVKAPFPEKSKTFACLAAIQRRRINN